MLRAGKSATFGRLSRTAMLDNSQKIGK